MSRSIAIVGCCLALSACTLDVVLAREDTAQSQHDEDVKDDDAEDDASDLDAMDGMSLADGDASDGASAMDTADVAMDHRPMPPDGGPVPPDGGPVPPDGGPRDEAGGPDAGSEGGADGGAQQWIRVSSPTTADLRGIWGSSSRDVWIVGDRGVILHWTGTAWSYAPNPIPFASYRDVWGSAADDVWAVGVESPGILAIAHYDGRSWARYPIAPTRYSPRAIFGTSRTDAWIVGGPFEFASDVVFRWNGGRWSSVRTGGSPTRYLDVGGVASDELWFVALDDTVMHWDGAFSPEAATLPVAVVSFELGLWAAGRGDFWVTGDAGIVHHYTAGSWTSVDTGSTNLLRNVFGLHPSAIWAVGNRGTIARFDGVSWSAVEETTPRTLLSVWASSFNDAWAIGEGGTILHSVR